MARTNYSYEKRRRELEKKKKKEEKRLKKLHKNDPVVTESADENPEEGQEPGETDASESEES